MHAARCCTAHNSTKGYTMHKVNSKQLHTLQQQHLNSVIVLEEESNAMHGCVGVEECSIYVFECSTHKAMLLTYEQQQRYIAICGIVNTLLEELETMEKKAGK